MSGRTEAHSLLEIRCARWPKPSRWRWIRARPRLHGRRRVRGRAHPRRLPRRPAVASRTRTGSRRGPSAPASTCGGGTGPGASSAARNRRCPSHRARSRPPRSCRRAARMPVKVGVDCAGPLLARARAKAYAHGMSGPSTRPSQKPRTFVPHPDNLEAVRKAFDGTGKRDALTPEESRAYARWLETGEAPDHLRTLFETGER